MNFETFMASNHKVWSSKAHDMRQTAELLIQYDSEVFKKVFRDKEPARLPLFWTAGPARMLMGFSLENLIKAVILKNPDKLKDVFSKEGNISWGKHGHDLITLSELAGMDWNKTQYRYLELWQICSTWAGRYPIPFNEHQLPKKRKGMPTREALVQRRKKEIEKELEQNDPFKGAELWDQLHTGINHMESSEFIKMYEYCTSLLEEN